MNYSLPPLDFKEDIENHEAKEEKTEIVFNRCKHSDIKLSDNKSELVCKCGASWSGSRLGELHRLLTSR